MNKVIVILVIVIGPLFISCKSANQKEATAQKNVAEAKQDLKNTQASNLAEWKVFKTESQAKIIDNEQRITELKIKMNKPGNTFDGMYRTRIEKLQVQNNELKEKLNRYDGNQTDWKTFKTNFNREMKEVGDNIKDLF
jgi:uncharacterized protein YeaO (DUF488 family)